MKSSNKKIKSSIITDPKKVLVAKTEMLKLFAKKSVEQAPILTKKEDELMKEHRKKNNKHSLA